MWQKNSAIKRWKALHLNQPKVIQISDQLLEKEQPSKVLQGKHKILSLCGRKFVIP